MINFCQKELPADSDAYGDWIYLDGAQTALVEYQVSFGPSGVKYVKTEVDSRQRKKL